jgi:hypothetical protein
MYFHIKFKSHVELSFELNFFLSNLLNQGLIIIFLNS